MKRYCNHCGKPMYEGYCIESDLEYYCSESCLSHWYAPEDYTELYEAGDAYWTEWGDEDEEEDE